MIICSLNVRGLSNDKKRRETFLRLKKKQFSIYFIQEVHSTKKSGAPNGGTQPYLRNFPALKQVLASYSITTFNSKYRNA